MRRNLERLRRRITGSPRLFAVPLATVVLAASLFSMVFSLNLVTVTDTDGPSHMLLTGSQQPEEIMTMVGVRANLADEVRYTNTGDGGASVTIRRAFPVTVRADGQSYTAEVLEGTVEDMLANFGVVLEGDDFCDPAPPRPVSEDMTITVHRVTYHEETRREEVHEDQVALYVAALEAGELAPVTVEGADGTATPVEFKESRNGMYDVTYRARLVDGEVTGSEIVALVPVVTPRDAGSTEFTAGVPCSTIDSFDGLELGADGLPTSYVNKIEGAVTTAYSSSGGRGASGLGLYCGTVAVNPNVIPYGSKLYITAADGSFVYGYAIATDTGTALMDGRVDIDLYFATNAECYRFGKRALDVYVLETP